MTPAQVAATISQYLDNVEQTAISDPAGRVHAATKTLGVIQLARELAKLTNNQQAFLRQCGIGENK